MRLVDVNAVIKAIDKHTFDTDDGLCLDDDVTCILEEVPTIEERKTWKWIEYDSDEDKYDIIKCPCCKNTFTVDSFHWTDIGFIKDDFKFCPNCGADMRQREE